MEMMAASTLLMMTAEVWFKANTPAVGQFYAITTDNARPYNVYGGLAG
jgi:hypothetical protein